jgi:hypothetical protein
LRNRGKCLRRENEREREKREKREREREGEISLIPYLARIATNVVVENGKVDDREHTCAVGNASQKEVRGRRHGMKGEEEKGDEGKAEG